MANTKSFFTLLAGLAAGAAFGILYAPDKGWKTRARVKKAAENGYEDLKENLGDLGAKVDAKTAEAKDSIKNIRETLREKGAEIKEGTRDMLIKQLERLENALKKAEEAAEESVGGTAPDEQAPEA
jgi:gas vesicle protein